MDKFKEIIGDTIILYYEDGTAVMGELKNVRIIRKTGGIDTDIQISTVNVIQYMHGSLQGRIKHRQGKKMD